MKYSLFIILAFAGLLVNSTLKAQDQLYPEYPGFNFDINVDVDMGFGEILESIVDTINEVNKVDIETGGSAAIFKNGGLEFRIHPVQRDLTNVPYQES